MKSGTRQQTFDLMATDGRQHSRVEWTTRKLQRLRELAPLGAEAVAEDMGLSVWQVRKAAARHRISLRREGSRAGSVLGQPRGVTIRQLAEAEADVAALAALRDAIAAGEVDPSKLERIVRRTRRLAMGEPVCPACGIRPQERATGLCDECHWRAMIAAFQEHAADDVGLSPLDAAIRDYERSRKAAQRAKAKRRAAS